MMNSKYVLYFPYYTYDGDCVKYESYKIIRKTQKKETFSPRKLTDLCRVVISGKLKRIAFIYNITTKDPVKIENFTDYCKAYWDVCKNMYESMCKSSTIKSILEDELTSYENDKRPSKLWFTSETVWDFCWLAFDHYVAIWSYVEALQAKNRNNMGHDSIRPQINNLMEKGRMSSYQYQDSFKFLEKFVKATYIDRLEDTAQWTPSHAYVNHMTEKLTSDYLAQCRIIIRSLKDESFVMFNKYLDMLYILKENRNDIMLTFRDSKDENENNLSFEINTRRIYNNNEFVLDKDSYSLSALNRIMKYIDRYYGLQVD
jgi:hypothetical protein